MFIQDFELYYQDVEYYDFFDRNALDFFHKLKEFHILNHVDWHYEGGVCLRIKPEKQPCANRRLEVLVAPTPDHEVFVDAGGNPGLKEGYFTRVAILGLDAHVSDGPWSRIIGELEAKLKLRLQSAIAKAADSSTARDGILLDAWGKK